MKVQRRNPYVTPPTTPGRTTRNSISRRIAAQVATRAAAAALNSIMPHAGTAFRVGRKAFSLYRTYSKSKAVQATSKSGQHWGGVSTHSYQGRFRKPVKKLSKFQSTRAKYLAKGFSTTKEVFGKVDDADCVYIGHSTYSASELGINMAQALIRKLIRKAGFDADSPVQEIPFYSNSDADGFIFYLTGQTYNGGTFTYTYTSVDNDTIESIATTKNWSNGNTLSSLFSNILTGSNSEDFDRISLYSTDRNGVSTNTRLAAEIDLKREVVDIYVASELTIQNRTKTASGSSETDQVDNQPLKGTLYHMAGGVPKMKMMGLPGLTTTNASHGILLQQAVDLSPAQLYKEPPHPKIFNNCYKSASVSLEPGTIKKTRLVSQWRGYFQNMLSGKLQSKTGTPGNQYAPGKFQLIALEERLNSGSTNLITVNYECDRKVMVNFVTTKKPLILPGFTSVELNNVTA